MSRRAKRLLKAGFSIQHLNLYDYYHHRWFDMSPVWAEVRQAAEAMDRHRAYTPGLNFGTKEGRLIGFIGEKLYSLFSGQPVDWECRLKGRPDSDFDDGVEVKTVKYWDNPWLKWPCHKPMGAELFFLFAVKLESQKAYLAGMATRDQLRRAEIIDWTRRCPDYSLEFPYAPREDERLHLLSEIRPILTPAQERPRRGSTGQAYTTGLQGGVVPRGLGDFIATGAP